MSIPKPVLLVLAIAMVVLSAGVAFVSMSGGFLLSEATEAPYPTAVPTATPQAQLNEFTASGCNNIDGDEGTINGDNSDCNNISAVAISEANCPPGSTGPCASSASVSVEAQFYDYSDRGSPVEQVVDRGFNFITLIFTFIAIGALLVVAYLGYTLGIEQGWWKPYVGKVKSF